MGIFFMLWLISATKHVHSERSKLRISPSNGDVPSSSLYVNETLAFFARRIGRKAARGCSGTAIKLQTSQSRDGEASHLSALLTLRMFISDMQRITKTFALISVTCATHDLFTQIIAKFLPVGIILLPSPVGGREETDTPTDRPSPPPHT
jgi:hypothetical protein